MNIVYGFAKKEKKLTALYSRNKSWMEVTVTLFRNRTMRPGVVDKYLIETVFLVY